MRVARKEILGPAISAIPFTDTKEVIERGNKSQSGPRSGVWTRNIGMAHRIVEAIAAGSFWIKTA
jgi:acyl-CoA reductase-like NAD-dependent aldehyde dehydrogenase